MDDKGKRYDESLPPEWLDPVALYEHFHNSILRDEDSNSVASTPSTSADTTLTPVEGGGANTPSEGGKVGPGGGDSGTETARRRPTRIL